MHREAHAFVAARVAALAPVGAVVEIGGRDINGTVRGLFGEAPYVSVDLADGPGVDVVADGCAYRPITTPAVVVCCEVLEHAPDAHLLCENVYGMLRPGGVFIVTAAGEGRTPHSAIDGGALRPGEFYRNVRRDVLEQWLWQFRPYVEIVVDGEAKDIYAFASKGPRA